MADLCLAKFKDTQILPQAAQAFPSPGAKFFRH